MDEKSILKRLRNRDEKAFEEIIDLYSAYVKPIKLKGNKGRCGGGGYRHIYLTVEYG